MSPGDPSAQRQFFRSNSESKAYGPEVGFSVLCVSEEGITRRRGVSSRDRLLSSRTQCAIGTGRARLPGPFLLPQTHLQNNNSPRPLGRTDLPGDAPRTDIHAPPHSQGTRSSALSPTPSASPQRAPTRLALATRPSPMQAALATRSPLQTRDEDRGRAWSTPAGASTSRNAHDRDSSIDRAAQDDKKNAKCALTSLSLRALVGLWGQGGGPVESELEADALVPVVAAALSHVPCKFFRQGACTAGKACVFSHDLTVPGTVRSRPTSGPLSPRPQSHAFPLMRRASRSVSGTPRATASLVTRCVCDRQTADARS